MGAIMAVMSTFTTEILEMPGLIGELSFLGYLIFVPLSAPLWYRYSDKVGIRKVLLLGAICMPIAGIPLFFAPANTLGFILTFVVASVAGIADGAIESMNSPVFSSIVDKTAVDNKRREEGLYRGVVVFFQRTSYFIWLFFLIIAQAIAGTNLGLRIYISLFPVMVMGIGVISFLKLYTITQEDLEKNILELEKLNV
jgi:Na+/melibiose symporter-like transporter